MIIPDANVLIYAYDESSPEHPRAKDWWESCLNGEEPVGLPWVVILAFTRLMTHPTLNENPMTVTQVRTAVDSWLSCDHVRVLASADSTVTPFFNLLESCRRGGNLSTEAFLPATCRAEVSCPGR